MEHDEQWARCCCRDTTFCCPQGEWRESCLSRDDWEDEWEDEEDDEWDRHHDADEDAIFAMLHEVHVLVVVVIVLLALLIVVLLAIAGLKYKAQAAAGSAIAAMGVELSTAGPSASLTSRRNKPGARASLAFRARAVAQSRIAENPGNAGWELDVRASAEEPTAHPMRRYCSAVSSSSGGTYFGLRWSQPSASTASPSCSARNPHP